MMKKIPATLATNIADPGFRIHMMRETVKQVHDHGELWLPLLNLITTFIDGLASGKDREAKEAYLGYLKSNFPELCAHLGAEVFYKNFRCAAVHEFSVRPPFALSRDANLNGKYTATVDVDGYKVTALNIDRLVKDFLDHLSEIEPK